MVAGYGALGVLSVGGAGAVNPFVDHTDLTEGDERVYSDAARAQRAVRHEEVDVRFSPGDDEA